MDDPFEQSMRALVSKPAQQKQPAQATPAAQKSDPFKSSIDDLQKGFTAQFGRPFRLTTDVGEGGLKGIHQKLYKGRAVDIGGSDLSDTEANWLVGEAQRRGLRVGDYRINFKQVGGSGPHIHLDAPESDDFEMSMMNMLSQTGPTEPKAVWGPDAPITAENLQRMIDESAAEPQTTPGAFQPEEPAMTLSVTQPKDEPVIDRTTFARRTLDMRDPSTAQYFSDNFSEYKDTGEIDVSDLRSALERGEIDTEKLASEFRRRANLDLASRLALSPEDVGAALKHFAGGEEFITGFDPSTVEQAVRGAGQYGDRAYYGVPVGALPQIRHLVRLHRMSRLSDEDKKAMAYQIGQTRPLTDSEKEILGDHTSYARTVVGGAGRTIGELVSGVGDISGIGAVEGLGDKIQSEAAKKLNVVKPEGFGGAVAEGVGRMAPDLVATLAVPGSTLAHGAYWAGSAGTKAIGRGEDLESAIKEAGLAALMLGANAPLRPVMGAVGEALMARGIKAGTRGFANGMVGYGLARAQGGTHEQAIAEMFTNAVMGLAGGKRQPDEAAPRVTPSTEEMRVMNRPVSNVETGAHVRLPQTDTPSQIEMLGPGDAPLKTGVKPAPETPAKTPGNNSGEIVQSPESQKVTDLQGKTVDLSEPAKNMRESGTSSTLINKQWILDRSPKDEKGHHRVGLGSDAVRQEIRDAQNKGARFFSVSEGKKRPLTYDGGRLRDKNGNEVGVASPLTGISESEGILIEYPAKQPEKPKYSYTAVNLPDRISESVRALGRMIPDEDLAADGREMEPHITVKYGLHGDDAGEVQTALAGEGPVKVKLGRLSLFENEDADVLKIEVDSPDLHRLNKKIAGAVENTETHPGYKPHVTIAYLKPGEGKKYLGSSGLEGQEITLDRLSFSDRQKNVTEIPLSNSGLKPYVAAESGPPVAGSNAPNLKRNFRAGRNDAEMVFASEDQRDLYDLGAKMRYQMRGGQNRTSNRAVGDIEGLRRNLAARLGVDEAEVSNLATEVYNDARAQMKGVGHLESRPIQDNILGRSRSKSEYAPKEETAAGSISEPAAAYGTKPDAPPPLWNLDEVGPHGKKIWETPFSEYVDIRREGRASLNPGGEADKWAHRQAVEEALADGRPVPREVLADYPDLASKNPAPKPAQERTVTMEIDGQSRSVVLTDEQARAFDEEVASYKERAAQLKRHLDTKIINPDEYKKRMHALGMRHSARKREISGLLTAKEQANADKQSQAVRPGRAVEVTLDGQTVKGKAVDQPRFGKVKVEFEDGRTINAPRAVVRVISDKIPSDETNQTNELKEFADSAKRETPGVGTSVRGRDKEAVFEQDPARTADGATAPTDQISNINVKDYVNVDKYSLSASEKERLSQAVADRVSETGSDKNKRVGFDEIKRQASEIAPELVDKLKPLKDGETLHPAVYYAAKQRLDALVAESDKLARRRDEAKDLTRTELDELDRKAALLDRDIKNLLDIVIPMRTQAGRNLAYERMTVDRTGFDLAKHLSRARRIAKKSGQDTESKEWRETEDKIKKIVSQGKASGERVAEIERQIAELRESPMVQAFEKAIKEAQAEGVNVEPYNIKRAARRAVADSWKGKLAQAEEAARARLKEKMNPNVLHDVTDIGGMVADLAIVGASKLARKGIDKAVWAREMIDEFGEGVRDHLPAIFKRSYQMYRDERAAALKAAQTLKLTGNDPSKFSVEQIEKLLAQAERERQRAMQARIALAREFQKLEKSSALDVFSAYRLTGMLSSLRMLVQDVLSTGLFQPMDALASVPGAMADMLIGVATKRRTLTAESPKSFTESVKGGIKGLKEVPQILKHGASDEQLERLELPSELNTGSRVIDSLPNAIMRVRSAADNIPFTQAFQRELANRARAQAMTESKRGTSRASVEKRTEQLIKNPDDIDAAEALFDAGLREAAEEDARLNTFNRENFFSKAIQGAKQRSGPWGSFFISLPFPFTRAVPNIIIEGARFTPLGFGETAYRGFKALVKRQFSAEDQRAMSKSFGKAFAGTGFVALGHILAKLGLITIATIADSMDDDRERDKAAGRKSMAFYDPVTGTYRDISWLGPASYPLAIGALWAESETTDEFIKSGSKIFLQNAPQIRGAREMIAPFQQSSEGLKTRGGRIVSTFMPAGSLLRDVAEATDSEARKAEGLIEPTQKNIPFLRNSLPADRDVFDRPAQHSRLWAIDPTRATDARDKTDPMLGELVRLKVGVSKPKKGDGESAEEYENRASVTGKNLESRLNAVISNRIYQQPPERVNAKAFQKKALETAIEVAREDFKEGRTHSRGDEAIILHNSRVDVEAESLIEESKGQPYYKKLSRTQREAFESAIRSQFRSAHVSIRGDESAATRLIDGGEKFLEIKNRRGDIVRLALQKTYKIED